MLVLNSRLSQRGGADRWLLSVASRLQPIVTTKLFVGYVDRDLPDSEADRVGDRARLKGLDRRGGRPGGLAGTLERLERELAAFQPDVVLVNDVTDPALLNRVARTERAVMMVQDHRFFCPGRGKVTAQGEPCHRAMGPGCDRCFDDSDHAEAMVSLTRRRLDAVKRMAHVTVLSRYMAGQLAAAGVDPARVTVLPPFVDNSVDILTEVGERSENPGEYHLVAGRLSYPKGVEVALTAAARLRHRLPLWVAGDGPLSSVVQSADHKTVRHLGWLDHRHLSAVMDRAASLWLPSLWAEPFGIVGLEAQARGLPVVAAHVGGVRDWLQHERTGLLVPPGDPDALAEAADRLVDDAGLAHTLAARALERVRQCHRPDVTVARLVDLCRQVASSATPGSTG